jgi:hypothetical protein
MLNSFLTTDAKPASSSPVVIVDTPQPCSTPPIPEAMPLRHLLIGRPEVVQHTIHRLHNLRYVEANFWSAPIPLSDSQLIVPLNPHEIMRILVRSLRVIG